MGKAILDPIKVKQLMQDGMSQSDVARYYGVDRSAVYLCCKKNNIKVNTQLVKDERVAKALIKKDTQALSHIENVLAKGERMVDLVDKAAHGDKEALNNLDNLGVKDKLAGWSRVTNDFVSNIKQYIEIHKIIFDVQHSRDFQKAILDAIKTELQAAKDSRKPEAIRTMNNLIGRLMENKTLRELLNE